MTDIMGDTFGKALNRVNAILEKLEPLDRAKVVRSANALWECELTWANEKLRLKHEAQEKRKAEKAAERGRDE